VDTLQQSIYLQKSLAYVFCVTFPKKYIHDAFFHKIIVLQLILAMQAICNYWLHNIFMETFAKNIKILREEKQLSKSALARELNLSHTAILNWENGTSVPGIFTFIELAKFFDVSIDYLVGLEK
jgi:DNA-binding XRE family transcriptional regulator